MVSVIRKGGTCRTVSGQTRATFLQHNCLGWVALRALRDVFHPKQWVLARRGACGIMFGNGRGPAAETPDVRKACCSSVTQTKTEQAKMGFRMDCLGWGRKPMQTPRLSWRMHALSHRPCSVGFFCCGPSTLFKMRLIRAASPRTPKIFW